MRKRLLVCLGLAWLIASPLPVHAQSEEAVKRSVDLIANTAIRLCAVIDSASGNLESAKVTGEAKAQINGLLRRLAELGIVGQGEVTAESYVGVLRSDLAPLITGILACRREVFNDLVNRLLPAGLRPASVPPPVSRPPEGRSRSSSPVVGSYSGEIENTTLDRSGSLSMEIKPDVYNQGLVIVMRMWGRLVGSATLQAQLGPNGDLRASGSLKAGSRTFFMNLAGRFTGSEIAGGFELVPSGDTRVSGSEGEFRVRKFVPYVGTAPDR